MEIILKKKDILALPGSQIKIETRSDGLANVTEKAGNDMVRYQIVCRALSRGDVFIKDSGIFSVLGDEIMISKTTRSLTVANASGLSFKQPTSDYDIEFPDHKEIGVRVVTDDLLLALKGICQPMTYGCLLRYENTQLSVVTTDRTQLTKTDVETAGIDNNAFSLVISETSVKNAVRFLEGLTAEDIEVINTKALIIVKGGDFEYCTPCLNVVFLDYNRMLEKSRKTDSSIEAEIGSLLHVIECASLMNVDILFEKHEDGTYITSKGDNGSFGPYKISENRISLKKILLDARKLSRGIRKYADITGQDKVVLRFQQDNKFPVFISGNNHLFLLMPKVMSGNVSATKDMENVQSIEAAKSNDLDSASV